MLPLTSFDPADTAKYPNGNGVINAGAADAGSKILIYNESQLNLILDFYNGSQGMLHAWEARYWTLDGDTKEIGWSIESVLNQPNPPISSVMPELYGPNEQIEGTYPISLVRQATTAGRVTTLGNTLSNEGAVINTEVIDIGTTANPKLWDIFNDHFTISIEKAGTKHTIFVGSLTGNLLQIGQASDIAEVLSKLTLDDLLTLASAGITVPAATDLVENVPTGRKISFQVNAVEQGKIDSTGITLPAANKIFANEADSLAASDFIVNVPTGRSLQAQVNAVMQFLFGAGGIRNVPGKMGASADGDILDASGATATYIKSRNSGGAIIFQTPNGTTQATIDGSGLTFPAGNGWKGASGDVMTRNGHFSGSGSGTYGHTLGVAPAYVIPIVNTAGSATQGWDSGTSTQVHITLGAVLSFNGLCFANS